MRKEIFIMEMKQLKYLYAIASADPREIWVRYHRKARIEKSKLARYEMAKITGKVPNPVKHLHDVSNAGQYVEILDNTDPREPMLSTDIPKTRTYRIAEALSVIGATKPLSDKQVAKIKKQHEQLILDLNRISEGIHDDPDSVKDPDGMGWAIANYEIEYDNNDYVYEQISNDKVESYASTYPRNKELTAGEIELQKAWNSFLKDHSDLVVEEFFELNYVRCYCIEPNPVHNEAFCPRCYRPNPAYQGYVAVYQGRLLTTQDMLYMQLHMDSLGVSLINTSDAYLASQDRILLSYIDNVVTQHHSTDKVFTVRMDNTDQ
jgi:hypothetical protein